MMFNVFSKLGGSYMYVCFRFVYTYHTDGNNMRSFVHRMYVCMYILLVRISYLAAAPDVVLHVAVAVAGADVHLGSQHLLDVLLPMLTPPHHAD